MQGNFASSTSLRIDSKKIPQHWGFGFTQYSSWIAARLAYNLTNSSKAHKQETEPKRIEFLAVVDTLYYLAYYFLRLVIKLSPAKKNH